MAAERGSTQGQLAGCAACHAAAAAAATNGHLPTCPHVHPRRLYHLGFILNHLYLLFRCGYGAAAEGVWRAAGVEGCGHGGYERKVPWWCLVLPCQRRSPLLPLPHLLQLCSHLCAPGLKPVLFGTPNQRNWGAWQGRGEMSKDPGNDCGSSLLLPFLLALKAGRIAGKIGSKLLYLGCVPSFLPIACSTILLWQYGKVNFAGLIMSYETKQRGKTGVLPTCILVKESRVETQ